MNAIKYFLGTGIMLTLLAGCTKENTDDISFIETVTPPANLSALFDITQDNTGLVTIIPTGEGAGSYDIYYGDGTTAPAKVTPGNNTRHVYAEGLYNVKIVAHGITGKTTEVTKQLTVSFRAPENMEVTTATDAANTFKLNVSAKALYETVFKVYFGDVANEIPKSFLEGETISHTYTAVGTYKVRVVALSGGVATTEITRNITIVNPVLLPLTFESSTLNYAFTNFDGGNVSIINNPYATGLNTSAKVGKMVKNAGQVWGGSFITLGNPIDFSTNKVLRMKTYSPRVGAKVLLKVENPSNGAVSFEKEVVTTVANAWEDLAFDFNAINTANVYQNIVLIFDLGTAGDGSANFTFLFDDIRQTNLMPSSQIKLPVTFDDPAITYTVIDFGNNQTTDATDPLNSANKVKKTIKPSGAQTWAGTTIGSAAGFSSPIPVTSAAPKMSIRVYAPAAGIHVRLKIEDHNDNTRSVETEAITTAANTWETLVFDFSNPAPGTAAWNAAFTYDKASVFFDFGNSGDGKIFYWDDVQMAAAGSGSTLGLPLNFESSTLAYTFTDFDGGNVTIVNNPQASGINTSAKVAKMVKNPGQVWGGSYITLDNPINFSGSKIFKMKVYSPRAGAKVLLKVENLTNGGISFEKEVTTSTANAWEELSFDFSGINTANSYQKIVLIFDLGTVGDGSANFTYYFDDITLN